MKLNIQYRYGFEFPRSNEAYALYTRIMHDYATYIARQRYYQVNLGIMRETEYDIPEDQLLPLFQKFRQSWPYTSDNIFICVTVHGKARLLHDLMNEFGL